eukprot:TRINITY_DN1659_c0_g1_i4.p2 TRINITY_DN1659_c0_g1~~TRINITY_DN1659_c0_g1_i4.p2  ORF type:complete len:138 (+),score=16.97 TRINITY_DN1659_c0_g1_i4:480-893(+)
MENIYKRQNPDSDAPMRIVVRINNTQSFAIPQLEDIKSSLIGKLAVVTGSVVRVSTINLLVLSMEFHCLDCRNGARVRFSNGKYEPLAHCLNPDCRGKKIVPNRTCLLYTSDAADDMQCVDLGGRRIIKKKKKIQTK